MIKEIIKSISLYYPFSIKELHKYQYLLDWCYISQNCQIKWNEKIVEEFSSLLSFSDDGLALNPSLPLDKNLISRFKDKWDWQYFTDSPAIPWSPEIIEEFKDLWTWEMIEFAGNIGLSLNERLPWTVELIDKYSDKWFWGELSCNPSLPWSKDLILRYYDRWTWDGHFGHWGLSINPSPVVKKLLLDFFPNKIDYMYFNKQNYNQSLNYKKGQNALDKWVTDYIKQYGIEKLILCINLTRL